MTFFHAPLGMRWPYEIRGMFNDPLIQQWAARQLRVLDSRTLLES